MYRQRCELDSVFETRINYGLQIDDSNLVRFLIGQGMSINKQNQETGTTPLMIAIT